MKDELLVENVKRVAELAYSHSDNEEAFEDSIQAHLSGMSRKNKDALLVACLMQLAVNSMTAMERILETTEISLN